MTYNDKILLKRRTRSVVTIMTACSDGARAQKIIRVVELAKRGILRWREVEFVENVYKEYLAKWEENNLDSEATDAMLYLYNILITLGEIYGEGRHAK